MLLILNVCLWACNNNEKSVSTDKVDTSSNVIQEDDTFSKFNSFSKSIITFADSAKDFVPSNYKLLECIYGDLNQDSSEDCILIVKATDTSKFVVDEYSGKLDRNRRGLIILFKKNHQYQLALKNLQCFYSDQEDGGVYYPPELNIEIKNCKLYIQFLHGRYGYWGYSFRYNYQNFELIGYDSESFFHTITTNITSINFITCTKIEQVNANEFCEPGEEKFKTTKTKFRKTSIPNLSQISEFESFGDYIYNAAKME